ncbi:MAG TPA: universal stress protein [Burkholderiales bacterium]|nr:universal stress protein [Burkholderiales bacterium]
MKILLAVDGSKHSLKAAKYLIEQANAYREPPSVELVHVHRPVPKLPNMKYVVSNKQIQQYYEDEGSAALSGAKKLLTAGGIRYVARILVGEPADTIAREAERTRCNSITIGTRGMTAAANLVLGSTATKVLHASSLPVTLVR